MLSRWQRRIAGQPGVRAVIGPGAVAKGTRPLRKLGDTLTDDGKGGIGDLARLGPGLRDAAGAVTELRSGLARGAAGSALPAPAPAGPKKGPASWPAASKAPPAAAGRRAKASSGWRKARSGSPTLSARRRSAA